MVHPARPLFAIAVLSFGRVTLASIYRTGANSTTRLALVVTIDVDVAVTSSGAIVSRVKLRQQFKVWA